MPFGCGGVVIGFWQNCFSEWAVKIGGRFYLVLMQINCQNRFQNRPQNRPQNCFFQATLTAPIIAAKQLVLVFVYISLESARALVLYVRTFAFVLLLMGAIVVMLPVPGHVGRWVQVSQPQRELAGKRDVRVYSVTETMHLIRIIKSLGWE
ncbi:hypothetical protein C8J57DRAFT_1234046 [Mycena rebaudengoi]|nr:hypothetical protein C8J57DRAFT_1234046 [Mycena rebaudengoi]